LDCSDVAQPRVPDASSAVTVSAALLFRSVMRHSSGGSPANGETGLRLAVGKGPLLMRYTHQKCLAKRQVLSGPPPRHWFDSQWTGNGLRQREQRGAEPPNFGLPLIRPLAWASHPLSTNPSGANARLLLSKSKNPHSLFSQNHEGERERGERMLYWVTESDPLGGRRTGTGH
jgi:hypothetical protein